MRENEGINFTEDRVGKWANDTISGLAKDIQDQKSAGEALISESKKVAIGGAALAVGVGILVGIFTFGLGGVIAGGIIASSTASTSLEIYAEGKKLLRKSQGEEVNLHKTNDAANYYAYGNSATFSAHDNVRAKLARARIEFWNRPPAPEHLFHIAEKAKKRIEGDINEADEGVSSAYKWGVGTAVVGLATLGASSVLTTGATVTKTGFTLARLGRVGLMLGKLGSTGTAIGRGVYFGGQVLRGFGAVAGATAIGGHLINGARDSSALFGGGPTSSGGDERAFHEMEKPPEESERFRRR
jgi:hypothetical protein